MTAVLWKYPVLKVQYMKETELNGIGAIDKGLGAKGFVFCFLRWSQFVLAFIETWS